MNHEELMAEIARPSTRIRFEEKVARIPEAGCWVWLGSLRGRGYGFFHLGGKSDRKGTGGHRSCRACEKARSAIRARGAKEGA